MATVLLLKLYCPVKVNFSLVTTLVYWKEYCPSSSFWMFLTLMFSLATWLVEAMWVQMETKACYF